jgi:hypothetical protein
MQPKVSLQVGGGTESLLAYVTLMGLLSYKHNIHVLVLKMGVLEVHAVTLYNKVLSEKYGK